MFRKVLDDWFVLQREQLFRSHGAECIRIVLEALTSKNLDPQSIDAALCKELKMVLGIQYDEPIGSSRLNGHGWSVNHVKEHMRRALRLKLQEVSEVVQDVLASEPVGGEEMASDLGLLSG